MFVAALVQVWEFCEHREWCRVAAVQLGVRRLSPRPLRYMAQKALAEGVLKLYEEEETRLGGIRGK